MDNPSPAMRKLRILVFEDIGFGLLIGWLMWKYPELIDDVIPWVSVGIAWLLTRDYALDMETFRRWALSFGEKASCFFCTAKLHNSFRFNRLRTLSPKHPGVGRLFVLYFLYFIYILCFLHPHSPLHLEKYPVLARTFTRSLFGLITIFRNVSSFNGSVG